MGCISLVKQFLTIITVMVAIGATLVYAQPPSTISKTQPSSEPPKYIERFYSPLNPTESPAFSMPPTSPPKTEDQNPASTPIMSPAQNYKKSMHDLATLLGWVPAQNLCGGYYEEPISISAVPNPTAVSTTETKITATQPSLFSQTGTSVLQGNVTITQPGREVYADKAYIYRDPSTGKVSRIELVGDVHYRETGKVLIGNRGSLNMEDKSASVSGAAYRIARPNPIETLNAWGTVSQAFRRASGVLDLYNATYSTCSPTNPDWKITAEHLNLNQETGRGTATNARLYAKNIPIVYLPYFDFPIDKRRYSGFLYPTINYSDENGLDLTIPYYLNLAPNYDDTIRARLLTRRGVQMSNMFQYLTDSSHGNLFLSFIPSDQEFKEFINDAPSIFPPSPINTPFLDRIADFSDSRGLVSFQNVTVFDPSWSMSLTGNYVTDDYFFQDLGNTPNMINTDQLLNQADLNYQNEHWHVLGRVQAYQTLHLINQDFVMDQYARLPQIAVSGNYPEQAYNLHYIFNGEFVNFQHNSDFFTGQPFPTGTRTNFNPSVSLPFLSVYGFFIPQLQLEATGYALDNNTGSNANVFNPDAPSTIAPGTPQPDNIARVLPMFNIDSGLYLERSLNFFGNYYRQTLEPRLFYLYVPKNNQDDIPIFDTTLPSFSYEELYRTNRFVGYDRIGDANQISAGFTSRLLDDYTGFDRFDFSVGEIFYFQKHSVCLYSDCSDDPTIGDAVSPIAGKMSYGIDPHWRAIATGAFDPNQGQTDNVGAHIQYMPAPQHIINLGYDFILNGDPMNSVDTATQGNNLSRIDLNVAWPVLGQWTALTDWNYNLSHGHFQTYMYGLEYNSCCWAVRLIASRTLTAEDINGEISYTNNYFVQILFKGLGNIGNSDPGNLLTTTIPGYEDYFKY
jgi:LPS-assembly protein